jgi:hypothetical protein
MSDEGLFYQAVDCVIHGKADDLRGLLGEYPELAREKSAISGGNLLHYVAANGVEGELQKTPPNAVEIAEILLGAGADPNATAHFHGGGGDSTPLVGLVSSVHPHHMGVQADLVKAFCAGGAKADGIDDDGMPMATALSFYYPKAAVALEMSGARADNVIFAAALGRLDTVRAMVEKGSLGRYTLGSLDNRDGAWTGTALALADMRAGALEQAFVYAAMCGQTDVIGYLLEQGVDINAGPCRNETGLHLATWVGDLDMVKFLVENGADISKRDTRHHSAPIGWAEEGRQKAIIDYLASKGRQ